MFLSLVVFFDFISFLFQEFSQLSLWRQTGYSRSLKILILVCIGIDF